MDLVERFSPQAEAEGLFTTEINFEEVFKGRNFGAQRGKERFLYHATRACHSLGITVGYRETPSGFVLGFDSKEDHNRLMAVVEPKMEAAALKNAEDLNRAVDNLDWFRERAEQRAQAEHATRNDRGWYMEYFRTQDDDTRQREQDRSRDDEWHHER